MIVRHRSVGTGLFADQKCSSYDRSRNFCGRSAQRSAHLPQFPSLDTSIEAELATSNPVIPHAIFGYHNWVNIHVLSRTQPFIVPLGTQPCRSWSLPDTSWCKFEMVLPRSRPPNPHPRNHIQSHSATDPFTSLPGYIRCNELSHLPPSWATTSKFWNLGFVYRDGTRCERQAANAFFAKGMAYGTDFLGCDSCFGLLLDHAR